MPRAKKDGVKYSLYIDRELEEKLRKYAAKYDLTLTAAHERAIKVLLDRDKRSKKKNDKIEWEGDII